MWGEDEAGPALHRQSHEERAVQESWWHVDWRENEGWSRSHRQDHA
jgi:hypothetical protein